MDLIFCGIIDIVFVLLAIVAIIIGYKKGFMHKFLSLFGFLAIVAISFAFCTQLADLLTTNEVIAPSISENIINSINTGFTNKGIAIDETTSVSQIIQTGLAWPEFLANIFVGAIGIPEDTSAVEAVASIADFFTGISMNIICFVIMFIGSYIILGILKIITTCLRGVFIIRFIDGVLGVVLYVALYLIVICLIFTVLYYCMEADWFSSAKEFLTIDLQLDNDTFRLSKWIYNTNPVVQLLKMFGLAQ